MDYFWLILCLPKSELLNNYLQLDELSERGEAVADKSYPLRLNTADVEELVDCLNRRVSSNYSATNDEDQLRQLLEVENECEKQFS